MQLWRRCVANWGVIHHWEKRSLHIQQVILTFYLTFFWGNIEKITKVVQYKIASSYHVSASSWDNTSFVLIQKPPKSALKLRGPFSPVLAIASLQLIGDEVFEQFLAVPQPECWGWLSQLPSLKLHQWSLEFGDVQVFMVWYINTYIYVYLRKIFPWSQWWPVLHLHLLLPQWWSRARGPSGSSMACHLPRGWDKGAGGGKILETASASWIQWTSLVLQAQQRELWVQSWSWGREQT